MLNLNSFSLPSLTSVKKIWDHSPHNALTDLTFFQNNWYCVFRESDAHVYGKDGILRLLRSKDGEQWSTAALFEENGIDLRDPKLSMTPTGQLMLLAGGTHYEGRNYIKRQPRVSFSSEGTHWSRLQPILSPHEWLWRLTWYKDKGYGASYSFSDPSNRRKEWEIKLFETKNGTDYTQVASWNIPGKPNETTLRFKEDGTMIALVRREEKRDNYNWIGTSSPPYKTWVWKKTIHHLGGPNFVILPSGEMWAAGRIEQDTPYGFFEKTALLHMNLDKISPVVYLPSGGNDCSYPGMVYHQETLWISYYSSHETNTAIYLAKLQFAPQK